MATEQQGPTPEFALAYRDIMLMGLTNGTASHQESPGRDSRRKA